MRLFPSFQSIVEHRLGDSGCTSAAHVRAGIVLITFHLLAAALVRIVVHVVIFEKWLAPALQATVVALGSKCHPSSS